MTSRRDALTEVLAQPGKHDPFTAALQDGLSLPAPKAVRMRFVIEIVAHRHDSLTNSLVTEPQAYQTFVRAASMLNAFLPEGRRR